MIDNRLEYQRMYEVERKLWWYKTLHGKVLTHLKKHFEKNTSDLKILDAACGTGGLLSFLSEKGYKNLTGFDYSRHAIEFSSARGLNVSFGDLKDVGSFLPNDKFDVICCNDALYFLNDNEIVETLRNFKKKLEPDGIIVINIHAFEAFSGTHDLAVGSSRRFVFADFNKYTNLAGLSVKYKTYWPFLLSLPIWMVRSWQKFRIKKGQIMTSEVDSDVSYPGDIINSLLTITMYVEELIFPPRPFGSSLFMVLA